MLLVVGLLLLLLDDRWWDLSAGDGNGRRLLAAGRLLFLSLLFSRFRLLDFLLDHGRRFAFG